MLIISTTPVTTPKPQNTIQIKVFNKPFFIEIPENKDYVGYEIISHKYTTKNEPEPIHNFITTDNNKQKSNPKVIYHKPITITPMKKGDKELLRIYAPEVYYDNGKKYTTSDMEINIIYESTEPKLTAQSTYNKQDNIDYIIITNETFYPIFSNQFKDWKIESDPPRRIESNHGAALSLREEWFCPGK